MPNRIIKESIRMSDTLSEVSAEAERLFWRLIVSADDFGRFDARPSIVLGQCLSAFYGAYSTDDVDKWLRELASVDLLQMYENEGRPYLTLTKWDKHQRRRAKDSKFPAPDDIGSHPLSCDDNRQQAEEIEGVPNTVSSLTDDSKRGHMTTNVVSNVFENVFVNDNEYENGNEVVNDVVNEHRSNDNKNPIGKVFSAFIDLYKHEPNSIQQHDLEEYLQKGMDPDLMVEDFREALRREMPVSYALKIIKNQFATGVTNMQAYEVHESTRQMAATAGGNKRGKDRRNNIPDDGFQSVNDSFFA